MNKRIKIKRGIIIFRNHLTNILSISKKILINIKKKILNNFNNRKNNRPFLKCLIILGMIIVNGVQLANGNNKMDQKLGVSAK